MILIIDDIEEVGLARPSYLVIYALRDSLTCSLPPYPLTRCDTTTPDSQIACLLNE